MNLIPWDLDCNMHQTIYIDIDEEITSIVERLRKSKSGEVIVVVPKRALLIQSIVNLKLLKKEAESAKKKLILVTQDKLGKLLIEKTGMTVEHSLDDIQGEEITDYGNDARDMNEFDEVLETKIKTKKLGSSEFYQTVSEPSAKSDQTVRSGHEEEERLINTELVVNAGKKKKMLLGSSAPMDLVRNVTIKSKFSHDIDDTKKKVVEESVKRKKTEEKDGNLGVRFGRKAKEMENFFQPEKKDKSLFGNKSDHYGNVKIGGGGFSKFFSFFGLIAGLIIAAVLGYLFLPRVDVKLSTKTESKSFDVEVKAESGLNSTEPENMKIPLQVVTVENEISGTFDSSGESLASNQRAKGTVTIYNEFSQDPQTLIATTRFEDEKGRIFRLVKTVIVPGMNKVDNRIVPGAIEADVVADGPGEDYNIDPARFSIPGFKNSGSEKYSKIYAKSFKSMMGGGNNDEKVKAVSSADISIAKTKLLSELTQIVKDESRKKAREIGGEEMIILEDSILLSEASYTLSNSEGEIADKFSLTVKLKAMGLSFNEKELQKVIENELPEVGENSKFNLSSLDLEYGKSDADFKMETLVIRANAKAKIAPSIDLDNLKNGILGKNEDEFKLYLRTYPEIEKAEIDYWPGFVSGKIPSYESRVKITIDSEV